MDWGIVKAEHRAYREKRCREKVRYLSQMCARNAAYLMAIAYPERDLDDYRCGVCGDWHLTTRQRA